MARLSWCGIALVASLVCSALAEDKYTNKFDSFDIEKVLSNHRILTSYIKCLLDEGTCTNEGRELKKVLPDALKTECSKCTATQKERSEKVITFLMKNRAADFERLSTKYDPTGEYKKSLEKLSKQQKPATTAAKH